MDLIKTEHYLLQHKNAVSVE